MPKTPPVVLTIAGFDPSSGAGVSADIKTIAAHGCYGVAAITALTVQSTVAVRRVAPVEAGILRETLRELASDVEFAAVKIGMLGAESIAAAVADFLEAIRPPSVVLDPILKSSSGADLLDPAGVRVMVERLFPLAAVITPNVDEAAALTGLAVRSREQMKAAALKLHGLHARAVVITGGHLDPVVELLSVTGDTGAQVFEGERLQSNSTHGTGCAFSTALACELARGSELAAAVLSARNFVRDAILNAYPVGKGTGPVNHFGRVKF